MATKKPQAADTVKPQYLMPAVEMGDVVLWHDSQDAPPTAMALVTFVGTENVNLAILGDGYQNFLVKTGVRHRTHPNRQIVEATDQGVWSQRPGSLRLLDRVLQLERLVNDLSAAAMASAK